MLEFSSFHTNSILTKRIYVEVNQEKSQVQATVFSSKIEKKGLGMTAYGNILGRFLSFMGFAFETKDENNKILYINKKSFCNLIDRLARNYQTYQTMNVDCIDIDYQSKKDSDTQQRLKKIYTLFDSNFSSFANKNIGEISIEMFKLL